MKRTFHTLSYETVSSSSYVSQTRFSLAKISIDMHLMTDALPINWKILSRKCSKYFTRHVSVSGEKFCNKHSPESSPLYFTSFLICNGKLFSFFYCFTFHHIFQFLLYQLCHNCFPIWKANHFSVINPVIRILL